MGRLYLLTDNVLEMVQDTELKWKNNGKLYVAHRMAAIPMTLGNREGHFCCLKLFKVTHLAKCSTLPLYGVFTGEPESALGLLLWPPCVVDADIQFYPLWLLSFFFLFSSPNLSSRRLDVYHASTHDVALVRI